MLYYPQLTTGSLAQFPLTRRNTRRTVLNTLQDGSDIRMADDGAAKVSWELTYTQLNSSEVHGIEQLFAATSGRWQTFTFLDPADNLLAWSEDLSQLPWLRDPLVSITPNIADAFGSGNATRLTNTAQATQTIHQAIAGPGAYQYCLSLYCRSAQLSTIELYATLAGQETRTQVVTGEVWSRVLHVFQGTVESDGVTAGIRLSPGQSLDCFGIQLEAQPGPGLYKKTRDRAGVYPVSRFDQDSLRPIATGANQFSCTVKIVSNVAG